jgi:hypothetical protein
MGCIFGRRLIPRSAVANIKRRAVAQSGCREAQAAFFDYDKSGEAAGLMVP